MSKNYCAHQFEDAQSPKRQNYYGAINKLPEHPKQAKKLTRFIANDQGHLAEAQDRKPGANPFGHFHGTWDVPCHIPGNHVENTINRSATGAALLRKEKDFHDAFVNEVESKRDFFSNKRKKEMAGIK
uniref:Cilia- and flagella-associated protein 126 n=1 Tax=Mesocestoides corti TaxID=53468 RepID=A0A5K3F476_MESCO